MKNLFAYTFILFSLLTKTENRLEKELQELKNEYKNLLQNVPTITNTSYAQHCKAENGQDMFKINFGDKVEIDGKEIDLWEKEVFQSNQYYDYILELSFLIPELEKKLAKYKKAEVATLSDDKKINLLPIPQPSLEKKIAQKIPETSPQKSTEKKLAIKPWIFFCPSY